MVRFTVGNGMLLPRDKAAHAWLDAQHIGDIVEVGDADDNADHVRRYAFMLIGRVAKALGVSQETMRARLLMETGRFDTVQVAGGGEVPVPHSMSRRAMSADDLRLFLADARMIIEDMLPQMEEADRINVSEMLKGLELQ